MEDLHKSAEIGKSLLEENYRLKDEAAKLIKEHGKKAEEWEQEKYTLTLKLQGNLESEKWYKDEIAQLERDIARNNADSSTQIEIEKNKFQQETRKVMKLQMELDQSHSVESQLREQISQLEALMERKMNETADITSGECDSQEMAVQIVNLHEENKNLETKYIEKCTELHNQRSELELLSQRLSRKDEEIEEIKCQATSYALSLERARSQIAELKVEMDAIRETNVSHGSKGNSLFSEVEDRRVSAEKKLISMKHRMEAQDEISKKQDAEIRMLRNQMMIRLYSSRGEADGDRIKQLETEVSQARAKISYLNGEIFSLEQKMKMQTENFLDKLSGVESKGKVESDQKGGSDKDINDYLMTIIKANDQVNENLRSELQDAGIQLMQSRNENSKLGKKLHDAESEREKIHNRCLRMQLKYDELLLKYEPESVKNRYVNKTKYIVEKIPVDTVSEQTIYTSQLKGTPNNKVCKKNTSTEIDENKPPRNHNQSDYPIDLPMKSVTAKVRSVSIADSVVAVDCDGGKKTEKLSTNCDRENKEKLLKETRAKPKGQLMTKIIKADPEVDTTDACKTQ
ncbi:protein Spindly-like [Argopecten irradians]|uniref:protein Spindly-like n=1 Tax=Argopecten irradians TaxID=31199 RepID=UPI0037186FB3